MTETEVIGNKFLTLQSIKDCSKSKFHKVLEIAMEHVDRVNIGGQTIKGINGFMSRSRGSTMGTIYLPTDPPIVFRGYPKIHYAEDNIVKLFRSAAMLQQAQENDILFCEEKLDGSNMAMLYDERVPVTCCDVEHFWMKTRLSAIADSYGEMSFQNLMKSTNHFNNVLECVKNENLIVYAELYGKGVYGDYVHYSCDTTYKVVDIVNRDTMLFLSRKQKEVVCQNYGMPIAELTLNLSAYLSDAMVREAIYTLEDKMEKQLQEGVQVEGMMMKVNHHFLPDQVMGKVKPMSVKEIAWRLADHKRYITDKWIKRTLQQSRRDRGFEFFHKPENEGIIVKDAIETLGEDWEEEKIIEISDKIPLFYRDMLAMVNIDDRVMKLMKMYQEEGYRIEKKGMILSMIAKEIPEFRRNAHKLYNMYIIARDKLMENADN
jgi:hypothetical protein